MCTPYSKFVNKQFVSEMDEENWIEEDLLIYVDYHQYVPEAEMKDPEMLFKIIGLDGDTVYSEINGKIFEGKVQLSANLRSFNT